MTQESPRYLFLNYWGKGKAIDLARAVKKAVNTQPATERCETKAEAAVRPSWLPRATEDRQ